MYICIYCKAAAWSFEQHYFAKKYTQERLAALETMQQILLRRGLLRCELIRCHNGFFFKLCRMGSPLGERRHIAKEKAEVTRQL